MGAMELVRLCADGRVLLDPVEQDGAIVEEGEEEGGISSGPVPMQKLGTWQERDLVALHHVMPG